VSDGAGLPHGAIGALGLALFALAAWAAPAAPDDTPPWLRDVLARTHALPETPRGAVVLETERRITVLESGRMLHAEHAALRIVTRDGAEHAHATAGYRTDSGRVRAFRAWLVSPAGAARELPAGLIVDVAYLGNDLYNEVRLRHLDAGDVPPGSVFAYAWTVEQDEPFAQFEHPFQDELPVLVSRLVLESPAGWPVSADWVNHDPVAPGVAGSTRTWELRDLPEVQDEPLRRDPRALVPRLDVTLTPTSGRGRADMPGFTDWREVARWLDALATRPGGPDAAVRAEARRLVAGARTELDTLRSLARFVQGLRYASIQMGIGRGGGYRPHPPEEVLRREYGDCKDKANLLRSLLAAVDHPAYLLTVYLGDPGYVREAWPSPAPFNHCITAIPLRKSLRLATEVAHPRFGSLLIFDPTDAETPLGDLSAGTQGGLGLVVAAEEGALIRLPELPPDANAIERHLELVLESTGDANGTIIERCHGQSAVQERRQRSALDSRDYRNAVVKWLRRSIANADVENFEVRDDTLAGRFETTIRFRTRALAQTLQGRLLVLKPPVLSRLGWALATDRPRRHPAALEARVVRETLVVHPPAGFAVDEMPEDAAFDGPLARFTARTQADGDRIVQTRALVLERGEVAVDRFQVLRAFFMRVRAAEDAPLVLARE
jgi:hypothetical protein